MTSKPETGATEDTIKVTIRSDADKAEAHRLIDLCNKSTIMTLTPPRASDELTSRMHCAIRCIAKQVVWAGEKLGEEDWKRLLVAGIYGQRVLPSPGGKGFVVLDRKTSRMSGSQKYDLTEFIYAFGAERGVLFDEPD